MRQSILNSIIKSKERDHFCFSIFFDAPLGEPHAYFTWFFLSMHSSADNWRGGAFLEMAKKRRRKKKHQELERRLSKSSRSWQGAPRLPSCSAKGAAGERSSNVNEKTDVTEARPTSARNVLKTATRASDMFVVGRQEKIRGRNVDEKGRRRCCPRRVLSTTISPVPENASTDPVKNKIASSVSFSPPPQVCRSSFRTSKRGCQITHKSKTISPRA